MFDLESSDADSLLPDLLNTKMSIEDTDRINEAQRKLNRQESIFTVYAPQRSEDIIENRQAPPVPEEHFGHRLHVKCMQLRCVVSL